MLYKNYGFRYWLTSGLLFCNLVSPKVASGQVIPDGTTSTPAPGSCAVICSITGGTTNSTGTNLFHSFLQFSIPEGGTAVFAHDPTIRNIFTRVTGNELSNINGLISTDSFSNTNLFLLNPNGIVFGPSGALDIGGSFVATTADAIQFEEQGNFSALNITTNPALLTVNPSAFLFSQSMVKPIVNQSNTFSPASFFPGLAVRENRSLLLVGGDISLEPPTNNEFGGNIIAPSGRIELGGLNGPGVIDLNINDNALSLTYGDNDPLANVSVNGARLDVSDFLNGNAAGEILVKANSFSSSNNSSIDSLTFGEENAGNITLHANNSINLKDTFITSLTNVGSSGSGGTLELSTSNLSLDNSFLLVSTFGTGSAGEVVIEAEIISILGGSAINSEANSFFEPVGAAGRIQIETNSLVLNNESLISTISSGSSLDVDASGELVIKAKDVISLIGGSEIRSETRGQRNASNIQVSTAALFLDNSLISAAVNEEADEFSDATGQGGIIDITTTLLSLLNGSQITSSTSGEGEAGAILLQGESLTVNFQDDSEIAAATNSLGAGGEVLVIVPKAVTLTGDGSLSTRSTGSGPAGDVSIQTGGFLRVQDGARVEVSGESTGNSGTLEVISGITVLNNGRLLASTQAGEDGNIDLNIANVLLLRGDSLISAEAFNDANGGNVDISSPFIIALFSEGPNGNDIQASAIDGDGGRISIQANTLFNIAENLAIDGNMTNDLDASSGTGIDGEVVIETLEIDPTQGTATLPSDPANPKIARGCQASGGNNGEFINSGRRGIPPNPYEPLSGDGIQEDIYPAGQTFAQPSTSQRLAGTSENTPETLIEAQGWSRNIQGDIVLLAENPESLSFCQRTSTGAS
ncbi:MAG: filamentous hemagglutinin N-terminal domain-containing protein [Cyanobacteria bacterium J06656_5]